MPTGCSPLAAPTRPFESANHGGSTGGIADLTSNPTRRMFLITKEVHAKSMDS